MHRKVCQTNLGWSSSTRGGSAWEVRHNQAPQKQCTGNLQLSVKARHRRAKVSQLDYEPKLPKSADSPKPDTGPVDCTRTQSTRVNGQGDLWWTSLWEKSCLQWTAFGLAATHIITEGFELDKDAAVHLIRIDVKAAEQLPGGKFDVFSQNWENQCWWTPLSVASRTIIQSSDSQEQHQVIGRDAGQRNERERSIGWSTWQAGNSIIFRVFWCCLQGLVLETSILAKQPLGPTASALSIQLGERLDTPNQPTDQGVGR